jgi:multidrug resistance efflux pump
MSSGIVESSSQGQGSTGEQQQAGGMARGRLVQRLLSAGPNLPAFMHDLLTTQAMLVAGTEAAGFLTERQGEKVELRPIAHIRPDESTPEMRAAAVSAFQEIIRPCVEQGKDGAIEIGGTPPGGGEPQFCLVTLLRNEGNVVAVAAVVARCRNVERAQQRLMSLQLVAGYFDLFSMRRNIEQTQIVAQSHQHVLQLASSVASTEGFEGAAMSLCNELANRTGATRVALGWIKGHTIKVKALSHTEQFDKKQQLIVQIEAAMEECIDQEEPVQFEPGGENTQNVTRAAQVLSQSQGGNTVLSLPLRRREEIEGAVTLEFPPGVKITPQAAAGLAVAVDLLAAQLYDRYQNDRWLITKAGLSIQKAAKKAVGPQHTLAKVIVAACLIVLPIVTFYPVTYRVSAPFEFTPLEKYSLCAPYEGRIFKVNVRPGAVVKKGQALLELDTRDLKIRWAKAKSEANAKRIAAENFLAEKKAPEAKSARAEQAAAEAEAELCDFQIQQATITAPEDGEVLKGDLEDKKDAPVKQGDVLMVVARRDNLQAEMAVNERDVQLLAEGQRGWVATTALPSESFKVKVDRIVPLGEAKEQSNVFRVFATVEPLNEKDSAFKHRQELMKQWRPGMEGEARIEVGKKSLLYIWTHRLVEFLRLKLWL